MATRRDDRFTALVEDDIVQAVCVIGLICEHLLAAQATDEVAGGDHVVLLSRPKREVHRKPKRIDTAWSLVPKPPRERPSAWA